MKDNFYDVIVIGGGHAGTEAALAAARAGSRTLIVTHSLDTLGQLSCNPAVGGIGKSHLVREIDALDGVMARAADCAGIHWRVLNASKGPAVQATRAQTDRVLYRSAIRRLLESEPQLSLLQQGVEDLIVEQGEVRGVVTALGIRLRAGAVVVTAGTFLAGRIHVGPNQHSAGRAGEPAANRLAERLQELPLGAARLKTGTPPRIDGRTIDFSRLEEQPGDEPRPRLSFLDPAQPPPRQVPCHVTETSAEGHDIIRASLDRSAINIGAIKGPGPRYCPSIEDKITRFADRESHRIFVEPEGLDTSEVYPNGISTSLPYEVQLRFVRAIKGFERAHITRPGYAIEYTFFNPQGLLPSLGSRHLPGLFLAGQVNGTTGYEEAAAQGIVAGVNAARRAAGLEAWSPSRNESYMGVMIDDLITQGVSEPYRMFTSRAEFRLSLREDNADARLTATGRELGIVGDGRWRAWERKSTRVEELQKRLRESRIVPTVVQQHWDMQAESPLRADQLLRRNGVRLRQLLRILDIDSSDYGEDELRQVEIAAHYSGYLDRQKRSIDWQSRQEKLRLPLDLDYSEVAGLSIEARQKLSDCKPLNISQASRISGVTPAAISQLLIHMKKIGNANPDQPSPPSHE